MKIWTDEMIALLGAESDTALGDRWGMSRMTVARKRQTLAIAPYDLKQGGFQRETLFRWSPENLALLGQEPDATVARRLGISRRAVYLIRLRQGLAPAKRAPRVYTLPRRPCRSWASCETPSSLTGSGFLTIWCTASANGATFQSCRTKSL